MKVSSNHALKREMDDGDTQDVAQEQGRKGKWESVSEQAVSKQQRMTYSTTETSKKLAVTSNGNGQKGKFRSQSWHRARERVKYWSEHLIHVKSKSGQILIDQTNSAQAVLIC